MKKNSFTLIELLAVIVVLAIIALITTPIILEIIENVKKESFKRSVELVEKATSTWCESIKFILYKGGLWKI